MKKSFWKRISSLSLCMVMLVSLGACGSQRQAQRNSQYPVTPKPMVTPWEYYQKARTAELKKEDSAEVQRVEMQTMGEDTKSDKSHVVLIGVLVGVTVVGGTVAAILLTR